MKQSSYEIVTDASGSFVAGNTRHTYDLKAGVYDAGEIDAAVLERLVELGTARKAVKAKPENGETS